MCRKYFENKFSVCSKFLGPTAKWNSRKKMLLIWVLCHFKTLPNRFGIYFLCLRHGLQNCMKWINNAFRCWYLCFCMFSWYFNPVDTTHLFFWEKIARFGCEIMTSLSVRRLPVACFFFWTIRWGIFLTLKCIEWRLEIWLLMGKQNNTKIPFSEVKCLLSSIKKILEEIFCMYAEIFKT